MQQAMCMGGGSAAAGDVILLMHMNGSDGSTTFTDSSSYGHSVTRTGSPIISTTWSKFGGASLRNSTSAGSSDHLTVAYNSAFTFGTSAFTLEFWLRMTTVGTSILLNKEAGTGYYPFQVYVDSGGKVGFRCYDNAGTPGLYSRLSTTTIAANTEYFVQCRRRKDVDAFHNDLLELAIGGTREDGGPGQEVPASMSLYSNTADLQIGNYGSGANYPLLGYIDDLRITSGFAREFAVPGSEF